MQDGKGLQSWFGDGERVQQADLEALYLSKHGQDQAFVFYPGLFAHGSIVKDAFPLGQTCKSPAPGISTSVHCNFLAKSQEHNFSN